MTRRLSILMCAAALGIAGIGCGDDDGGGGGTAGTAAGTGAGIGGGGAGGGGDGGAGGGGESCEEAAPNPACPDFGMSSPAGFEPKGACCYRTSNCSRNPESSETLTLEYRLKYYEPYTQPNSLGDPLTATSNLGNFAAYGWVSLFRFENVPRSGSSDDVVLTAGAGRYNCDGTYSFLKDAAIDRPGRMNDPTRWDARRVTGTWNWDWPEKFRPNMEDVPKTRPLQPVYNAGGEAAQRTFSYETPTLNQRQIELPITPDQLECVGERDGTSWNSEARQSTYVPMSEAHLSQFSYTIPHMTLCQYIAFGVISSQAAENANCLTYPREWVPPSERMTGAGAPAYWKHFPDSLCPENDSDPFHCHLGATVDENGVPSQDGVDCSQDAPSSIEDQGQCCDPLGQSDSLPACNAWNVRSTYIWAAVDITDETVSSPVFIDCSE